MRSLLDCVQKSLYEDLAKSYIDISGIINESVNIKGFSKWCDKNVTLTEEDYKTAKTTFEGLDKKLQNVLNDLYKDLGIEVKEEDEETEKRNGQDGNIKTTGEEEPTEGNDGDGESEEDDEKLQEKLESPEVKQQVTLINATQAIEGVLQSPSSAMLPVLIKDVMGGKVESAVETILKILCNAGNNDFDWIISMILEAKNSEPLINMCLISHNFSEELNQKDLETIEKFIGAEM